jgi:hypothetical protein
MKRTVIVIGAVLALAACRDRKGEEEARQAVQTYLAKLVEAYRTSNPYLMEPLVGEQQSLKLLGLIGVKRDAGVALDARILELQFTRFERSGDGWTVETKERWYYADRKLGTQVQVGPDSTDSYEMRYVFLRKDGRLVLEDLQFASPPVVGRTTAPLPTAVRDLHGLPTKGAPSTIPQEPEGPTLPAPGASAPPVGAPRQ